MRKDEIYPGMIVRVRPGEDSLKCFTPCGGQVGRVESVYIGWDADGALYPIRVRLLNGAMCFEPSELEEVTLTESLSYLRQLVTGNGGVPKEVSSCPR